MLSSTLCWDDSQALSQHHWVRCRTIGWVLQMSPELPLPLPCLQDSLHSSEARRCYSSDMLTGFPSVHLWRWWWCNSSESKYRLNLDSRWQTSVTTILVVEFSSSVVLTAIDYASTIDNLAPPGERETTSVDTVAPATDSSLERRPKPELTNGHWIKSNAESVWLQYGRTKARRLSTQLGT